MTPSLIPGAGPAASLLQRALLGIGVCISLIPPRLGWDGLGWAAEVPGKCQKAPGCGVPQGWRLLAAAGGSLWLP